MDGLWSALSPAQWSVGGPDEADVRVQLARDADALMGDAEAALEAREPVEMVMALMAAAIRITARLRDRVLDTVVASEPPPDHVPE